MKQAELQDVKQKLQDIFVYYTSFGDRLNTTNLKSQKFHKMMQDAKIMGSKTDTSASFGAKAASEATLMNKKRIDLIFCSVNKHKVNMSFELFLQALVKIGQFKYTNMNPGDALKALVQDHLLPLHDKIAKSNKVFSGKDGNAFEIKFDELVALVLRDVGSILLDIYQVYFAQEVKGNTGGMPE